ncbi:MAG: prepilin-type N-terminal cleavage/methylation domain-containing protein, partial [Thiomicrorhabdus sp.]|nr:prepilin-type N-terminal cleavage/methylation domain-containing protein [Thiomicrorhabdus sp.]
MQVNQINREQRVLQQGYTLVEMAVVLVIVAILIGGLFKGKEFIENAKLKTVINDFEQMTQAYYTYIQRTGHAPGLVRGTDGHIISDTIVSTSFFQDLIAEGLVIGKQGSATITNSYGG